ncbi:hypothetical protein OROHE_006470 [Orobanche hederae]
MSCSAATSMAAALISYPFQLLPHSPATPSYAYPAYPALLLLHLFFLFFFLFFCSSKRRSLVVRSVKLSEYIGKKYVILFFYPLDFAFVCPTEITAFGDRYEEFQKLNTEVLGVSINRVKSLLSVTVMKNFRN